VQGAGKSAVLNSLIGHPVLVGSYLLAEQLSSFSSLFPCRAVFFYWIWTLLVCGAADGGERGDAGADSG